MSDHFHSGLWSEEEARLSINVRELLAAERGLRAFLPLLKGHSVTVFCDNTTAISYLRHQGGTLSPTLNAVAQRLLRWAEAQEILLFPEFVLGKHNVVADALSRPDQVLGSEWTLYQEVFDSEEAVASDGGSFCYLTESPFVCLFCSHVGSDGSCD